MPPFDKGTEQGNTAVAENKPYLSWDAEYLWLHLEIFHSSCHYKKTKFSHLLFDDDDDTQNKKVIWGVCKMLCTSQKSSATDFVDTVSNLNWFGRLTFGGLKSAFNIMQSKFTPVNM